LNGGRLPETEEIATDDELAVVSLGGQLLEERDELIGEVAVPQFAVASEVEIAQEVVIAWH
jgi:hypothetical protein